MQNESLEESYVVYRISPQLECVNDSTIYYQFAIIKIVPKILKRKFILTHYVSNYYL